MLTLYFQERPNTRGAGTFIFRGCKHNFLHRDTLWTSRANFSILLPFVPSGAFSTTSPLFIFPLRLASVHPPTHSAFPRPFFLSMKPSLRSITVRLQTAWMCFWVYAFVAVDGGVVHRHPFEPELRWEVACGERVT